MPPTPAPDGPARSVDEVNREMRALWVEGVLADPARYEVLLAEYAEAVRRDVVEAA